MGIELRTRGEWPGRVQMRRGWALAHARPWNDRSFAPAALRLERGNDRFLELCAQWLVDRGADDVLSPALPHAQTSVWRRAGFEPHLQLLVFERQITHREPRPEVEVTELAAPDLEELARIDADAFDTRWQVGVLGIADAIAATPTSVTLAVLDGDRPAGFVIVGEAMGVGYLQRLAVDPGHAGKRYGRSLVRAAVRWASRIGARTMLLNTQPENQVAAALYRSEGFIRAGPRLEVLAWSGSPKEAW